MEYPEMHQNVKVETRSHTKGVDALRLISQIKSVGTSYNPQYVCNIPLQDFVRNIFAFSEILLAPESEFA